MDLLESLDDHPWLAEPAAKILASAANSNSAGEFLAAALPIAQHAAGAEFVAILRGEKGKWRSVASIGASKQPPSELLNDVLDRERSLAHEDWFLSPIGRTAGELLVIYRPWGVVAEGSGKLSALVDLMAQAIESVRSRERGRSQVQRLEAILKIAGSWRQSQETHTLLHDMAEASTRLLRAERASIFLWDKRTKTLVGRPALGVEGNELRVPDNAGVVGQVVQTGLSRRVDADIEQDQREVDRAVDRKLKFQTRSLICVPLRSRHGDVFGAFEVINKIGGNFTDDDVAALEELAQHAALAIDSTRKYEQLLKSRNQIATQAASNVELLGECPAIAALRSTIQRIADTELAILILGENGTGKEVVSQMIHYLSRRRNEPLIAVNCAAIAETLLESELFGHEKGAFTDAREMRPGKFELANRGTLFLDEIGEMSLAGQAKLLRVLEEKVVVRVGGSQLIPSDARVIAATNKNLAELVQARRFREDLYFRLNVVTLELPPLRSRGDDILLLAEHFLNIFSSKTQRRVPKLTAAAKKRLLMHPWPGNVRELRNLMERLVYLTADDKIEADDLAFILSPRSSGPGAMPLDLTLTEATRKFQMDYIKHQIDQARGNMSAAAEKLGLHRSNLYRKMRQLEMGGAEEIEDV
jgi:transcriptional regulator with GAF, ATPase, and Fis domain